MLDNINEKATLIQLKDKNGNPVVPITTTEAITDSDGNTIPELIDAKINEQTYNKTNIDERFNNVYTKEEAASKAHVEAVLLPYELKDNVYDKDYIDEALNEKANVEDVYTKEETYTKTQLDDLLKATVPTDVYTKGEIDTKINDINDSIDTKANSSEVYTKEETYDKHTIDSKISESGTFDPTFYYNKEDIDGKVNTINDSINEKANVSDVYTKTEVDNKVAELVDSSPEALDTLKELADALGNDPNFATTIATQIGTKANISDVYNKSETWDKTTIENKLAEMYKKTQVYNKTEVDGLINDKANVSDVYTKEEVDNAIASAEIDAYTKDETDTLLNAKANVGDSYTKAEVDTTITSINSDIATKANVSDVYTKEEIDEELSDKVDIDTLNITLDTKADKTTVTELTSVVATKANSSTVSELSNTVDGIIDNGLYYEKHETSTVLAQHNTFVTFGQMRDAINEAINLTIGSLVEERY